MLMKKFVKSKRKCKSLFCSGLQVKRKKIFWINQSTTMFITLESSVVILQCLKLSLIIQSRFSSWVCRQAAPQFFWFFRLGRSETPKCVAMLHFGPTKCVRCPWEACRKIGGHYKWHFFSLSFSLSLFLPGSLLILP